MQAEAEAQSQSQAQAQVEVQEESDTGSGSDKFEVVEQREKVFPSFDEESESEDEHIEESPSIEKNEDPVDDFLKREIY
jgi:hypothetical protein